MIIFYSTSNGEVRNRLLRIIQTVVSEENMKICRSIDALSKGLRKPRNDMNVAILHASTRTELLDFISLRDLLWDMKIILILPDSDPDTVAKGHILRPRFLSYCDNGFTDVAAVISRMIGNMYAHQETAIH